MTLAPRAVPAREDVTQAICRLIVPVIAEMRDKQQREYKARYAEGRPWSAYRHASKVLDHLLIDVERLIGEAHTTRPDAGDEVEREGETDGATPVRDRAHALELLDDVDSLVRFCSVSMPDVQRYSRGGIAFWRVVHWIAAMREGVDQAIVEQLRKALEPFAAVADEWDHWQAKGSTSTPSMLQLSYGKATIGLPEYQAARTAIISISQNDAIAERGAA